jgi:hypothetical protein
MIMNKTLQIGYGVLPREGGQAQPRGYDRAERRIFGGGGTGNRLKTVSVPFCNELSLMVKMIGVISIVCFNPRYQF